MITNKQIADLALGAIITHVDSHSVTFMQDGNDRETLLLAGNGFGTKANFGDEICEISSEGYLYCWDGQKNKTMLGYVTGK